MDDGIIELGSPLAIEFGFVRGRFCGYLWKSGKAISVSFIEATHPGRGHFTSLVRRIFELGYQVRVPTPLGRMEAILRHWGWKPHVEDSADVGPVEYWTGECPGTSKLVLAGKEDLPTGQASAEEVDG